MTLLVLDHPDLLSRSAMLEAFASQAFPAVDQEPRKPHRMRFHYGFDQHRLDQEDQATLRQHAAYLKAHPDIRVIIHGHADAMGNETYNGFLSRLRASAVARLLRREGVQPSRITLIGWASRKPLARLEDHAANRRLELEYLSASMG